MAPITTSQGFGGSAEALYVKDHFGKPMGMGGLVTTCVISVCRFCPYTSEHTENFQLMSGYWTRARVYQQALPDVAVPSYLFFHQ